MDVWTFSSQLTRRLLTWSVLSVLVSVAIVFSSNPVLRGFGIQFLAWGSIDGAIAIFGAHASAKRQAKIKEVERVETEIKEARWLNRILWINTGLDVFYVLGGFWLVQNWGAESLLWKGHSLGIILQGGFLFFFDFFHALSLRNNQII